MRIVAAASMAWMAQACLVPTVVGYDDSNAGGIVTIASFAPSGVTCDTAGGYTGVVTYTACIADQFAYTLGGCALPTPVPTPVPTEAATPTPTVAAVVTPTPTAAGTAAATSAAGFATTACHDVKSTDTIADYVLCQSHLTWAMDTGISDNKYLYHNFTAPLGTAPYLTPTSPAEDFQCSLFAMRGSDESGQGWGCPRPCTATIGDLECHTVAPTPAPTLAAIVVAPTPAPVVITAAPTMAPTEESASLPWWAILLLIVGVLSIIGAIGFFLFSPKKAAKPMAKKRALAPAPAPPPPAPAPQPQQAPLVFTSQPIMTTAVPVPTAQPVLTTTYARPQAIPMQATYAPLQTNYARPQVLAPLKTVYARPQALQTTYAQPQQVAPPVQTVQMVQQPQVQMVPQPVTYAAPPVQSFAALPTQSFAHPMGQSIPMEPMTYQQQQPMYEQPVNYLHQM